MPDALDGDYSRSRALLIGTWKYRHLQPVPAAKHSLNRMQSSPLYGRWPDGRVSVVANRDRPGDLRHELVTWFSDASDIALFYYVGHGKYDNDERLCLALRDTSDDPILRTTSLTFDDVRHAFRASKAAPKIVILDCCCAGSACGRRPGRRPNSPSSRSAKPSGCMTTAGTPSRRSPMFHVPRSTIYGHLDKNTVGTRPTRPRRTACHWCGGHHTSTHGHDATEPEIRRPIRTAAAARNNEDQ